MVEIYEASAKAPINLAVIKYWGKRDVLLNLPSNSSLSITLSAEDLCAHTTVRCMPNYNMEDKLWLNGELQNISLNRRVLTCIRLLRNCRQIMEQNDYKLPKLSEMPLLIISQNNFRTAAGLASSAAGFAALSMALKTLYNLSQSNSNISIVARQGSGSSCRSLFGGFVAWRMGELDDGSDSFAEQIVPSSHWPDIRAVILVDSDARKDISSSAGMQITVSTSEFFSHRASVIVPNRMRLMESAIRNKDFKTFAKLTMQDSNSFHAVCLDSDPPIFYLNDTSRGIIRIVETINKNKADMITIAAYTFDAGPNAVIFYLAANEAKVLSYLSAVYSSISDWPSGISPMTDIDSELVNSTPKNISRIILTRIGEGAHSVDKSLIGGDISAWL